MRTTTKQTFGICHECKGRVRYPQEYHPYLYCELVKLGHNDPAAYLASYGFKRAPSPLGHHDHAEGD